MSDITNDKAEEQSFLSRVLDNDATRKGLATAAAGVSIALVSEALWPSSS